MYKFPFSLPPFYIAIIRCLGVLEGLAIQVDPKARIISEAYPYVASRVLTDPQDQLQEALRGLALTPEGNVRWDRLEGLLEEAKGSVGYDVTLALDLLTDYLVSDEGDKLLKEVSSQIVDAADTLGAETIKYTLDAARALSINDEVAAVRAFRSLQTLIQADGDRVETATKALQGGLPELSPAMKRFSRILSLLGAQNADADPAKLVPIARKLSQDERVRQTASEILARIGERVLSRSLRAVFGLPAPTFATATELTTMTEDRR